MPPKNSKPKPAQAATNPKPPKTHPKQPSLNPRPNWQKPSSNRRRKQKSKSKTQPLPNPATFFLPQVPATPVITPPSPPPQLTTSPIQAPLVPPVQRTKTMSQTTIPSNQPDRLNNQLGPDPQYPPDEAVLQVFYKNANGIVKSFDREKHDEWKEACNISKLYNYNIQGYCETNYKCTPNRLWNLTQKTA